MKMNFIQIFQWFNGLVDTHAGGPVW